MERKNATSLNYVSFLALIVVMAASVIARAQDKKLQLTEPVTFTYKVLALTFPEGKTISVKLKGTDRLPQASGEAKVESKKGMTEIEIELDEMKPALSFGGDYNTYILWSASPEGLTTNLGEFVIKGNRGKLNVSTRIQSFGLFVTAEPHYLVRKPSRMIVVSMTDLIGPSKLSLQTATIEYRGDDGIYAFDRDSLAVVPEGKSEIRTEIGQAQTAVRLAIAARAEELAPTRMVEAKFSLNKAEEAMRGGKDKRQVAELAKEAVRLAYDAQVTAEAKAKDLMLEAERKAEADAQAQKVAEAQKAELARAKEEQRRAEAEADRARAQAEEERARAAEAEANRRREEADKQRVEAERQKELARQTAEQAVQEKVELRRKLLEQFNAVLPTKDTDRGLVVNLGDVLFDTGKFALRPEAREKLARFGGIVSHYPELKIQAEGHTDTTGGAEFNLKLSDQRAAAVREYLVAQGLPDANITSIGRGSEVPVADNRTAKGRQSNRRVELIISGEVIGTKVGSGQ